MAEPGSHRIGKTSSGRPAKTWGFACDYSIEPLKNSPVDFFQAFSRHRLPEQLEHGKGSAYWLARMCPKAP